MQSLKLDEIDLGTAVRHGGPTPGELKAVGLRARFLGKSALALSIVGVFIPVIGFFMLIAAWLMSRRSLVLSRDHLLPDEDERAARWAQSISVVMLIFSAIGMALLIVRSL